jgi:hypothetical protein
MNGALLRLKSLNLSYSLPSNLFHSAQITGVRVYFTGDNLHVWTHTKDWDPELGGDFRTYPILTGYTFGVNVSF